MTMEEQSDTSSQSQSSGCCSAQTCCAYFMMAFSALLLFSGMFLAFFLWNYMWLIVSAIGVILLFAASCMYYCTLDKPKNEPGRKRVKHSPIPGHQRSENEDLLIPSAPLHNAFSSASQLCLLPSVYFQGGCDDNFTVNPPNAPPDNQQQNFNQITLNGHNFLLVPLNSDGSVADTTSLIGRQVSETDPIPSNQESGVVSTQSTITASSIVDSVSNIQQSMAPESLLERPLQNSDCVESTNNELYVTILNENNNDHHQIRQNQDILIGSNFESSLPCVQNAEHSICIETATSDANEQTSPSSHSCDSSLDLSSNASTVVYNVCSNATVPKITLNPVENHLESSESQNQILIDLEDNIPLQEALNVGGATGVDTLHPDYVSASDDDSISCGRSSPPPSYAEVAQEEGFSSTS